MSVLYAEDGGDEFRGECEGKGLGCLNCGGDEWFCFEDGDELVDICRECGWEIRSSKVPKGIHEEVQGEEEGPFDTGRTMIDEFGNTWVWDKEREIYVNCGVQK